MANFAKRKYQSQKKNNTTKILTFLGFSENVGVVYQTCDFFFKASAGFSLTCDEFCKRQVSITKKKQQSGEKFTFLGFSKNDGVIKFVIFFQSVHRFQHDMWQNFQRARFNHERSTRQKHYFDHFLVYMCRCGLIFFERTGSLTPLSPALSSFSDNVVSLRIYTSTPRILGGFDFFFPNFREQRCPYL